MLLLRYRELPSSKKTRLGAGLKATLVAMLLFSLFAAVSRTQAQGQVGTAVQRPAPARAGQARQLTLEDRLVIGLQARRPSEIAFIEAVVDTVNRGDLPVRLVDRTFFWARARSPRSHRGGLNGRTSHRAIIYFQAALTIQAERLKIDLRRTPPPPTGN